MTPTFSLPPRLGLAAAAALLLAFPASGRGGSQDPVPVRHLFEEIHLLHQLGRLRLAPDQLQAAAKAQGEVEAARRKLEGRFDTPEIRAAAGAVRQALLEGRPEGELEPLLERLELLRADRGGEDDEPEERLHALAREQARALLNRFRADQLVRLVGEEEDDGLLHHLLRETGEFRRVPEPERKRLVERMAERLSLELTRDVANTARTRQELEAFLGRLVSRPPGEAPIGALAAELNPILQRATGSALGELQWRAERRLGELLMHPRLGPVLAERMRRERGPG